MSDDNVLESMLSTDDETIYDSDQDPVYVPLNERSDLNRTDNNMSVDLNVDVSEVSLDQLTQGISLPVNDECSSVSPKVNRSERAKKRSRQKSQQAETVNQVQQTLAEKHSSNVSSGAVRRISNERISTSTVWKYFSKLPINANGKQEVQCSKCFKKLAYCSSTTGMSKHIKAFHWKPEEHPQLPGAKKKGPMGPSGDVETIKSREFMSKYIHAKPPLAKSESQMLDRSLARFVVDNFLALRIVDSASFKDLMNNANPQYKPPCRETLQTNVIYPMYYETKETVMGYLKDADSIALTTDCWTSLVGQPYLSLTVHVIDEDFNLRDFLLGTVHAPESHTGQYLYDKIEGENGLLAQWNLLDKDRTYVTDNATNIKKAIIDVGNKMWIGCLGHTTNLIVKAGLEKVNVINSLIGRAKNCVSFIRRSALAIEKLKSNEDFLKLPNLNVIQDVSTRWNSVLAMLRRLVAIKSAVNCTVCECGRQDLVITDDDFENMELLSNFLQMFEKATEIASGDQYTTISFIQRIIASFHKRLAPNVDDPAFIADLKKVMLDDLKTRYQDESVKNIIDMAAALDPRFKSHASGATRNKIIELAENLNESEYFAGLSQIPDTQSQNMNIISRFPPTTSTSTIQETIEDDIFNEDEHGNDNDCDFPLITLHQKITLELTTYIHFPPINKEEKKII